MSTEPSSPVTDGIPRWQDFMIPVLKVLSDGTPRRRRDLIVAVQDVAELTAEQRSVQLNSGQSKIENRVGWALSDLTTATAVRRPVRATFEITELGRKLLQKHPLGLDRNILATIDAYRDHQSSKIPTSSQVAKPGAETLESTLSPQEQIEVGIDLIHADVSNNLIERLRASDPAFFEQAVVDLLLKMGYGGAEQRGKRIGGTGDGGVDGVIDQDPLGLDKVYVQAKRYGEGNNISRETVQAFVGALQGVGASKGVFITTSSFTPFATGYASSVPSRVILIDGERLAALMIKYRVGVQVKESYDVVELDEDFFE
ncbi:restriction endonuclease [Arthrobacter sp. STN4]|uniref:restriction endonuclease n=1 Tax=Arthrobacter sp. STN4 TaxID=2923276 RepID=UPI00211A1065|nr:restriction endonuclease [Arthrobacter sp. STN4]MCQ9164118.1 restriction endonuclease [Arthrobacter sp. STN4]